MNLYHHIEISIDEDQQIVEYLFDHFLQIKQNKPKFQFYTQNKYSYQVHTRDFVPEFFR
jgi:hypothetical protein